MRGWLVSDYFGTRAISLLTVHGAEPGTTNVYRVLAKAGDIEAASAPVQVITVQPSEARLLLHLDFEKRPGGNFTDAPAASAQH